MRVIITLLISVNLFGQTIGQQITADMTGTNQGNPYGVPSSYDWYSTWYIQNGNNATGYNAMTAWGIIYPNLTNFEPANTRVNIANMQTYVLSTSTHLWTRLQLTSAPSGAAYTDSFVGDVNQPWDVRTETDGTISVTCGGPNSIYNGYNCHFYPTNRGAITPSDIGGIFTTMQLRLIMANPSNPDDRATSTYLGSCGADYWQQLTSGNNTAVGGGILKYITNNWQQFTMTTLTAAQINSNPPPLTNTLFTGISSLLVKHKSSGN